MPTIREVLQRLIGDTQNSPGDDSIHPVMPGLSPEPETDAQFKARMEDPATTLGLVMGTMGKSPLRPAYAPAREIAKDTWRIGQGQGVQLRGPDAIPVNSSNFGTNLGKVLWKK